MDREPEIKIAKQCHNGCQTDFTEPYSGERTDMAKISSTDADGIVQEKSQSEDCNNLCSATHSKSIKEIEPFNTLLKGSAAGDWVPNVDLELQEVTQGLKDLQRILRKDIDNLHVEKLQLIDELEKALNAKYSIEAEGDGETKNAKGYPTIKTVDLRSIYMNKRAAELRAKRVELQEEVERYEHEKSVLQTPPQSDEHIHPKDDEVPNSKEQC